MVLTAVPFLETVAQHRPAVVHVSAVVLFVHVVDITVAVGAVVVVVVAVLLLDVVVVVLAVVVVVLVVVVLARYLESRKFAEAVATSATMVMALNI